MKLYARNGWDVVINCSRDTAPAQRVAAECEALGGHALVVRADVSNDADCRRLAAEVETRFGRADVLVNNAGTTKFVALNDLEALQAEDFQRIYAVNVIGAYQMTRAAAAASAPPGTGIVNVSSIASMMGRGSSLAYMASKGALNALTVGLARSLGPGVRVNAIAPGLVETPWLQEGLGAERYAAAVQGYRSIAALDAVISPDDVADAAWWLGAGAAKTTGEVLLLDAGLRTARLTSRPGLIRACALLHGAGEFNVAWRAGLVEWPVTADLSVSDSALLHQPEGSTVSKPCPTHRLFETAIFPTLVAVLVSACGGGDPAVALPEAPLGVMGKVTGLPNGVMEPGTYTVAGCVAAGTSTAVQRKLRVNVDGSLEWLNAASGDAVLFTLAPSSADREERILYYFQPNNWGSNVAKYNTTTGAVSSYVISGPTAVHVLYNNALTQEDCAGVFSPTLQVTNAGIAARLGSAVALNGTNGLTGGPLSMNGVSFTSISVTTAGAVTTHTAEPGSSPVGWGSWLTTAATTAPSYYEEHFTFKIRRAGHLRHPRQPDCRGLRGAPQLARPADRQRTRHLDQRRLRFSPTSPAVARRWCWNCRAVEAKRGLGNWRCPAVALDSRPAHHVNEPAQIGGAWPDTVRINPEAKTAPRTMPTESANRSPHSQARPGTNCCRTSIRPP